MEPNLKTFIRQISKEKDLELDVIKEAIEQALVSASKKNLSSYVNARPELDMESGTLHLYVTKTVVESPAINSRTEVGLAEAKKLKKGVKVGEEVEVEISPASFGRIAAQSAKQIVMQRLRDAEREKIYDEFKDKEGHVVTGVVQRFERRDGIINIGKTEGILPLTEQPMGSRYRIGDRLRVLIQEVKRTPKGPVILLSRKDPNLVIKLFEQEVPEMAEGVVKILTVAREPGVRTKIAVISSSTDVDPVGACVGMKGSRVQMVVRELENEKIDIVPYSTEARAFIAAALNPAKVKHITLHQAEQRAEVIVAKGNLSLAIGRKGQNTKLASKLTGWKLDLRSEEEMGGMGYEEIQTAYLGDFLAQIQGLSDLGKQAILRSQYKSVEKIAGCRPEDLLAFSSDSRELAEKLIEGASEYLEALREMEAKSKVAEQAAAEEAKAKEAEAKTESEAAQQEAVAAAAETEETTEEEEETAQPEEASPEGESEESKAAPSTEEKT
ncbi:MAG: transcription termination factor NusA [bacterium]